MRKVTRKLKTTWWTDQGYQASDVGATESTELG